MPRSFPPDVIVLESDSLLHARFGRGKKGPVILLAKSYRLAADAFTPAMVTPELVNESVLGEAIRRLKSETGRWDKVSLLLPDSWFRMNVLELPELNERQTDAMEVVRWSLKRTLPIPPDQLRLAYEVISRTPTLTRVLVVSALDNTLTRIEAVFAAQGLEVVLIEPLGLSLWNAIAIREENATASDRLLVYVRHGEFTTGVFRGSQPLFLRSRNLSRDRTLQQEIRLSAGYLRDSLGTTTFARCYVAGTAGADVIDAIASEFASPVKNVTLREFFDDIPGTVVGHEAELTACAGVFTG